MKRTDLLRHLLTHGCQLLREGRSHSVWVNPANGQQSSIPRHREVNDDTARGICRQLGQQGFDAPGRPGQDVYVFGPPRARQETEALGQLFIGFLQSVGIELKATDHQEYVRCH